MEYIIIGLVIALCWQTWRKGVWVSRSRAWQARFDVAINGWIDKQLERLDRREAKMEWPDEIDNYGR